MKGSVCRWTAIWVALLMLITGIGSADAEPSTTPEAAVQVQAEPTPSPTAAAPQTAVIRAVGDIMLHEQQLRAHKTQNGYDFSDTFALIEDSLQAADYAIGNLEGTVGKSANKGYSGFPLFNAPEGWLDALKDAGFDMLTMANNHMYDRYADGVTKTLDLVDERGFDHVGAYRSQAERDTPLVIDVNGIKIGMLAYTEHTNGMERYVSQGALPYAVSVLGKSNVPEDIRRLKEAGAELVVACLHWGEEYKRKPNASTKGHAKKLAGMGVDVIIGSHPHVAQGIEYVKSDDGARTALVAYSLGNFVGYMQDAYTDGGLIFEFTVQRGADGTLTVRDPKYVPVYLWKGGTRNNGKIVRPVPAGKLWKNPEKKMSKGARAGMKKAYRALVALLKKSPAEPLDE